MRKIRVNVPTRTHVGSDPVQFPIKWATKPKKKKKSVLPLYCIPRSLVHCPTTAACFNASWPPAHHTISSTPPPITSMIAATKRTRGWGCPTPAVDICNCQSLCCSHPEVPWHSRGHRKTAHEAPPRRRSIYERVCSCRGSIVLKGRLQEYQAWRGFITSDIFHEQCTLTFVSHGATRWPLKKLRTLYVLSLDTSISEVLHWSYLAIHAYIITGSEYINPAVRPKHIYSA